MNHSIKPSTVFSSVALSRSLNERHFAAPVSSFRGITIINPDYLPEPIADAPPVEIVLSASTHETRHLRGENDTKSVVVSSAQRREELERLAKMRARLILAWKQDMRAARKLRDIRICTTSSRTEARVGTLRHNHA
ncbi:hypothetical protein [Rhizobium sp.]|uniref:hypothetical protein n=1 Tax=Rhizobium sp. TaxID=391 RepID=UPI002897DDD5